MSHVSHKYPGQPWQIKVFADGSTEQSDAIVLSGENTLLVGITYRGPLEVRRSSLVSWQWSQLSGSGAATIAFTATNETKPIIGEYPDINVWSTIPTTFSTLPSGGDASEILPMSDVIGTYLQVVIVVGGSNLVGFRLTGLVK